MRAFRTIALSVLLTAAAGAAAFAQAVIQTGPIVPGHAPVFVQNGQISDAGSSTNGFLTGLGLQANGTPFCINDGPISGAYHQLCLGANASTGGGLLSYQALGGAAQLPFEFLFNGNAVTFSGGSLTLGTANTQQGSLLINGGTSGTVMLKTALVAGTYNFILPQTAGAAGQPLLSGGGGSSPMTWGSISGNTTTFATTSGAFTLGHCLSTDASGNIIDSGSGCGGSGTVNTGTTGQFAYYASSTNAVTGTSVLSLSGTTLSVSGTLNANPSNANVSLAPTGTGVVTINPGTQGSINNVIIGNSTPGAITGTTISANNGLSSGVAGATLGSLSLSGNTSGTVVVKTQAAAGSYNFNLPITAGSTNQPLLSGGGGAGAMTWGTLAGNTTSFATTSGALTSGHVAAFDASGNIIDGGSPPTGTINSGTAGRFAWYAGSGTTLSDNANLTISGGAVTVGIAGSSAGSLAVTGSSTGTITLKGSGTTIGTYNWNFPTSAGSSGNILASGGGGTSAMTWDTVSGNTTTLATVTGALTNGHCLAADASGNIIDNGSTCGTGGSGTVTSSTAGQIAYYPSSTNAVSGNSSLTISGAALTVGVAGATTGSVSITGSTSGTVSIKTQNTAGTYNFNLPTTAGSAGQVLTSQGGAGTAMTWTAPGTAWGGKQSSNFSASAGTRYCVDTTGGAVTMTLPASPNDGDAVYFMDCEKNFGVTALTIARNGKTIMLLSEDVTVNTVNASGSLFYVSADSNWVFGS